MNADNEKELGNLKWLPGAAAILAFVACNGLFILVGLFALFGVTLVVNPHIQAAVISVFAVLTLVFVFLGYQKHRVTGPVILAVVGAMIIVGSMYIYFNKVIESIGLIVLFASAIWSWRVSKS